MGRLPLVEAFSDVIKSHQKWLEARAEPQRTERWIQLLRHQPEPAIVEAAVRQILESHVDRVESNESLSHGGPDFRCYKGCGAVFCRMRVSHYRNGGKSYKSA